MSSREPIKKTTARNRPCIVSCTHGFSKPSVRSESIPAPEGQDRCRSTGIGEPSCANRDNRSSCVGGQRKWVLRFVCSSSQFCSRRGDGGGDGEEEEEKEEEVGKSSRASTLTELPSIDTYVLRCIQVKIHACLSTVSTMSSVNRETTNDAFAPPWSLPCKNDTFNM